MYKEKFGSKPFRTSVLMEDNLLKVDRMKFNINEIQAIYYYDPTTFKPGKIYISLDGLDASGLLDSAENSFDFVVEDKDKIHEFLDLLDVEVISNYNKKNLSEVEQLERKKQMQFNKAKKKIKSKGLQDIRTENVEHVQEIFRGLSGLGLMETGMSLSSLSKYDAADRAQTGYLSALVEQNWVIISQNDRLLTELEQLNKNLATKQGED